MWVFRNTVWFEVSSVNVMKFVSSRQPWAFQGWRPIHWFGVLRVTGYWQHQNFWDRTLSRLTKSMSRMRVWPGSNPQRGVDWQEMPCPCPWWWLFYLGCSFMATPNPAGATQLGQARVWIVLWVVAIALSRCTPERPAQRMSRKTLPLKTDCLGSGKKKGRISKRVYLLW